MKILFTLFLVLFQFATLQAQEEKIPEVLLRLNASSHSWSENMTTIALNFENHPGWHTYWKNPGDAGLSIKVQFEGPDGVLEVQEHEWPVPHKYIEGGGIMAYGYGDAYSLFYSLPNEKIQQLNGQQITIKSNWLICKHVCIPGKAELVGQFLRNELTINQGSLENPSEDTLRQRFQELPQKVSFPTELDLILAKDESENGLVLYYNVPTNSFPPSEGNLLFPLPQELFDFKHEKLFNDKKGTLYGRMDIGWDGEYAEPSIKLPQDGKFQTPYTLKFLYFNSQEQRYQLIEKTFTSFSLSAATRLESFLKMLDPLSPSGESQEVRQLSKSSRLEPLSSSFFIYILMALIGGLILNVMPCVLPVISLKLFGLIQHSEATRSKIFRHNFFYTLGVLVTFFILALVVIAIQYSGKSIGWGFQLQSPHFVMFMIVVLFLMALNLFGLFEFFTPGGILLGGMRLRDSFIGDFFSGVLATILSTPCSAPFLGTALTFAFSSSPLVITSIFMAIGFGLAAPFILTAFFPTLIKWLPRPGAWMEHLKKFLGLTLILTAIWLFDVFSSLVNTSSPLIKLNTALVLLFFAFYLRKNITKKKWAQIAAFALPLLFLFNLMTSSFSTQNDLPGASALLKEKRAQGLEWEKWSPQKMDDLKAQGDLVFIDFTAKWCFTCKVNEKLVLETDGFKELISMYNVKLLLADWTKRDDIIGNWLSQHGMVGVPAYFIQKRDGTLISLGETISLSEIEKHLK